MHKKAGLSRTRGLVSGWERRWIEGSCSVSRGRILKWMEKGIKVGKMSTGGACGRSSSTRQAQAAMLRDRLHDCGRHGCP